MENLIIVGILVFALTAAVLASMKHFKGEGGCCGGGGTLRTKKKLKGVVARKTIKIEGMMCANCEARTERFLNDIDGVSARANHKKNQAVILMSRNVSEDELRAAVEKAGYRMTGME